MRSFSSTKIYRENLTEASLSLRLSWLVTKKSENETFYVIALLGQQRPYGTNLTAIVNSIHQKVSVRIAQEIRADWLCHFLQKLQNIEGTKGPYGIMVCRTDFANATYCDVMAYERASYGSILFDIYVIRSGTFRNTGEGGFINWCFTGYKSRDSMTVTF